MSSARYKAVRALPLGPPLRANEFEGNSGTLFLRARARQRSPMLSPHFSPGFYCGGGSGHVCCVALPRAPRRTVEYGCGALGRAPCIHARLRRLATKPGAKRVRVRSSRLEVQGLKLRLKIEVRGFCMACDYASRHYATDTN